MSAAAIREWAERRGLELEEGASVRPLTPALVAGRGGFPLRAAGELADGVEGELILTGGGSTVVLTRARGSAAFVPALSCRDRAAAGGRLAELPAETWEEVRLESAGFNERYSLQVLRGQDPVFVRELFSPALIAWLERDPPAGFSFELNEGNLSVIAAGSLGSSEEVARHCDLAVEVAGRLGTEVDEEDLDPDVFDEAEELSAIERGLDDVDWDDPPASVREGITRCRRRALRKPKVILSALIWTAVAAGLVIVPFAIGGHPLAGIVLAVPVAAVAFALGLFLSAARYRWGGTASTSRVGLEVFARGYARSRGLRLEDRWRFHAAHRDLAVPGFADHVMTGTLPGTESLLGSFLMLGDAAELRTLGQEVAYTADRPLASSALLVEADRDLPAGAVERIELPDEYSVEISGRQVLVWRPIAGNLLRTAEGSDRFCANAGKVVGALIGADRQ